MSLSSQLAALCRSHPAAPKVVFVPRPQVGEALQRAVARRAGHVAGLRCLTPLQYAADLARTAIVTSDRTQLLSGNRPFLSAAILKELDDDASLENLPAPHRFARTVASSVQTLRLGSVGPEVVARRADDADASETLRAVARCYDRYLQMLDDRGLYDEANVYFWAVEQIERGAVNAVEHTVYGVTDAVELSECEYHFVKMLRQTGGRFVRLGSPPGSRPVTTAPRLSAAFRFSEADTIGDVPPDRASGDARQPDGVPHRRFVRAVGAANEVRAAVRDLVADAASARASDGGGLDGAELAYTDSRPYLSLIVDTLDRLDVDATIATGLPGAMTRVGRSIDGLYRWVVEDFDPEILIGLLRSGEVRVDRWMEEKVDDGILDPDETLTAHEVATCLAGHRYEDGRHGYAKTLTFAIEDELGQKIDTLTTRLEEGHYDDGERAVLERAIEREERTRQTLEIVRSLVADLIRLASGVTGDGGDELESWGEPDSWEDAQARNRRWTTAVADVATTSRRFLDRFGPVDKPPTDQPEEERTLEERARLMFDEALKNVTDLPVPYEATGRTVAALMSEWVENQYVPPDRPRSGAVHVVPLESAGYSGRSRLYVVGGDSDTLSTTAVDDAMLRDADRRALSASLEGALPEQGSAADEELWRVRRALDRREGPASFYTRVFDVGSGEERYPSSLFLRLEAQADDTGGAERRTAGFLPETSVTRSASGGSAPSTPIRLTNTDAWLASYRDRGPGAVDGPTARDRLAEVYAWICDGEDARRQRRSDQYTEHDGLLAPGTYPDLDFFSGEHVQKMSAGRLETLAETPYVYFLRYVLGVDPLDEPALDDEPWMNRLRHGDILHQTFEEFMTELDGAAPSPLQQEQLRKILQAKVDRYARRYAPPSKVVREGALRRLWKDALVFLRSEAERAGTFDAVGHEVGFGFGPHRRQDGDLGDVTLDVGTGDEARELRLRGRIDRVDRLTQGRHDGRLAIWDYKTGSSSSYDEDEPLQEGQTLQWALYAYALEEAGGESVAQSGYFFTSTSEMGTRLVFEPDHYRQTVAAIVRDLNARARTGTFPMTPDAPRTNAWKYRGYDRLFPNLRDRGRTLKTKDLPDGRGPS